MVQPVFALTIAALISANAGAQDWGVSPGRPQGTPTKKDPAPAAPAAGAAGRATRAADDTTRSTDRGFVPGPLRDGTVGSASVFYDNGSTDGEGKFSNGTVGAIGARRTLLDDFTVGDGTLAGISWTHTWAFGTPPLGTGAEFSIRDDAGGAPGAVTHVATITSYSETTTGNLYFQRPEVLSCVELTPIALAAGTHWLEGTVVGPHNNLWLGRSTVTGSECWVNYDDLGGLQSIRTFAGVHRDLNFKLDDVGCACVPTGCSVSSYDNGPTDGSNGYSNATVGVFGARRTLLDDFTLTGEQNLLGLRWTHVWANGQSAPFGTGAELSFRADAGGSPGALFYVATVADYVEVCTGNAFFSRPEAESTAEFIPLPLPAGTRWIEGTIVGADNNFWLVKASVSGSECWVDYDDLGGPSPGSALFGVPADLNFCLVGAPTTCSASLYDNGKTDASNGYSNATVGVFGARRTLLDDFHIGNGTPSEISWTHLWQSSHNPPFGTDAEMFFRHDAGGSPGATFTGDMVTGYTETATGNVYFDSPEALGVATLDAPPLLAGTYWVEGTVVGQDNNFWLVKASVTGSECWVDYDDFGGGGLRPGSEVFDEPADLNFCLGGVAGGPETTCDPFTGQTNNTASISISGTTLGSTITVDLTDGPAGEFTYLLIGDGNGVVNPPLSKGHLCLLGGSCLGRYAKDVGVISGGGTFSTDIRDPQSSPSTFGIPTCGGTIDPGETWSFQYWHRQPMGQPTTFSQAIRVTFTN